MRSYPASVAWAAFVGRNLGLATSRTAVGSIADHQGVTAKLDQPVGQKLPLQRVDVVLE
jgi:hypothetical protein